MQYLEDVVRRMMWRIVVPTKTDATRAETIHRTSCAKINLKISPIPDTPSLSIEIRCQSINQKQIWVEEDILNLVSIDFEPSHAGRENFETMVYYLIVWVRRMIAKHDQETP